MKAKQLMIVLFIIIALLLVIIVAMSVKNNKVGITPPNQTAVIGENKVEEFVQVQADGSKVNTSKQLSKTKTIDGVEISNIRLVENNNVSQVRADLKNSTSKVVGDFPVEIIVLDKNGNELVTIGAYIDRVEPGKTAELNASATVDFANAYDFKIVKK